MKEYRQSIQEDMVMMTIELLDQKIIKANILIKEQVVVMDVLCLSLVLARMLVNKTFKKS